MQHDEYVEYLVSIGHDRATAQTMASAYAGRETNHDDAPATASDKQTMTRQERIGGVVFGLFLMLFGTPFVLLPPWMMWFADGTDSGFHLFLICFPIPFIFAGGLVMWMGGSLLVGSIRGVQGTHPLLPELRTHGVQVTNRSQDTEDGMEASGPAKDGTDPYASSAYPSMEDLTGAAGNDALDPAGTVKAPHVSPPQTEDVADVGAGAFWGNLSAADDEN